MADRIAQVFELLIEQYKNSPNLKKILEPFAAQLTELDDAVNDLLTLRSFLTARGEQLDVIGRIIGLPRPQLEVVPDDAFAFDGATEGAGFGTVNDPDVGGVFVGLEPLDTIFAPDSLYRDLLRARIVFNNTNATLDDILRFMEFTFGVGVTVENSVGFIGVTSHTPLSREQRQFMSASFPVAGGVRFAFVSWASGDNPFGFEGNVNNKGFGQLDQPQEGSGFVSLFID